MERVEQLLGESKQAGEIADPAPIEQKPEQGRRPASIQRKVGNQAVQRMVQAKLEIGRPAGPFEQEADRVAGQLMRFPSGQPSTPSSGPARIQRKCAACASGQTLCTACAAEEASKRKRRKGNSVDLEQRQAGGNALVQLSSLSAGAPEVTPEIAANIRALDEGGEPLPDSSRSFFEQRIGHDFSRVRVHSDSRAADTARSLNAQAFTVGHNIAFAAGKYKPESREGKELVAHELTHVVQQGEQGQNVVQRRVDGDVTAMSITAEFAAALDDRELQEQIQIVRAQLASLERDSLEYDTARSNLEVLETEQNRHLAADMGLSLPATETVPRPSGLPLDHGFILQPLPESLAGPAASVPEGRLTTVPATALLPGAAVPGEPLIVPPSAIGTPVAAGSLSMLRSINASLTTTGFAAAGENAIGVIGIPRWFTPGARVPETLSAWGHTAAYMRVGGKIQIARGFMPASTVHTLLNYSAVKSGVAGTPGYIANDLALFTRAGAMSMEYPVTREVAEAFARSLPEVGAVDTLYTARPAMRNLCVGTNCVLWAVGEAESALGGPIGPRTPGLSVTALGEAGEIVPHTASQGRLIALMRETTAGAGEVAAVEEATGSAVASGMPKSLQVLKWGGRIFLVIGVATIPLEVALAPEEERARTAVGATSGFLGGLALGASVGLVCGPGALACSLILGVGFGLAGYFGGRAIGEGVYDAATGRTRPSELAIVPFSSAPFVCFTADIRILLSDSSWKKISEVEIGDSVLSYDETEDSVRVCEVKRVFKNPPQAYLRLELGDDIAIKVTRQHQIYANGQWGRAGEIAVGDTVLYCGGISEEPAPRTIRRVSSEPADLEVYDISVEGCHNYFAEGVLAHNKLP